MNQRLTIQDVISRGYQLVIPGKSKGARAGNPEGAGSMTTQVLCLPKLRDSLGGIILMGLRSMQENLKATRKVDFSGELLLPAHEFERAHAWIGRGRSNVFLKVEEGDVVRPGDELFSIGPSTRAWSRQDCAAFGKVLEAEVGEVEFLTASGAKGKPANAAEVRITINLVIEAYDLGDAKLRRALKAMVQSAEAAGVVDAKANGKTWRGAIAGTEGLVKLEDKAREGMKLLEEGVEAVIEKELNDDVLALYKEIYKGDTEVTFDGNVMTYATNSAFIVELTAIIESATVAESVGRSALGLPQALFLSAFPTGDKVIRRHLEAGLQRRIRELYYTMTASSPIDGGVRKNLPTFVLGTDTLTVEFAEDATDEVILNAVGAAFPEGIQLVAGEERFYLRVDRLKPMLAMDDFKLIYIDMGSMVMNLLRGAMDPAMAIATKQNWEGMIRKVRGDIGGRLTSQNGKISIARIYGEQICVSAKVIFSDVVEMDALHISPYGGVARYYAELFDCEVGELDGQRVYALRDPGVVGGVYRIVLDPLCTLNTMTVCGMRMRPENGGDADGDLFKALALTEEEAIALKAEMEAAIPGGDSVKRALGVSGNNPAMKMFGENLKGISTFNAMVDKTKVTTVGEWLQANANVARSAKELMTVAYDAMEATTLLFALGKGNIHSVLLSWFLYEHRGLSGDDLFSKEHAMVFNLLDLYKMGGWNDGWESTISNAVAGAMVEIITPSGFDPIEVLKTVKGGKRTQRDLIHAAEFGKLKNSRVYESYDYEPWAADFTTEYRELGPVFHMLWCLDRRRFGSAGKAALALTKETETGEMFMDAVAAKHGIQDTFAFHIARTAAMWIAKAIDDAGGDPLIAGWYAIEFGF